MVTLSPQMLPELEDASSPPHIKDGNTFMAAAGSEAVVHPNFPESSTWPLSSSLPLITMDN